MVIPLILVNSLRSPLLLRATMHQLPHSLPLTMFVHRLSHLQLTHWNHALETHDVSRVATRGRQTHWRSLQLCEKIIHYAERPNEQGKGERQGRCLTDPLLSSLSLGSFPRQQDHSTPEYEQHGDDVTILLHLSEFIECVQPVDVAVHLQFAHVHVDRLNRK